MTQAAAHHTPPYTLVPQGDRCLILQFGTGIDVAIGKQCAHTAHILRQAQLPGVTDIVPTFNSVAVHYRPQMLGERSNLGNLSQQIARCLQNADAMGLSTDSRREVEIPVCYGGDYGPDLDSVAKHCGLSPQQVIELHSGVPAYVFMLGFAPGAPYIGVHNERLAIGRRATPRTVVPAGSVAIANRQTVIYPNASPGGWHLIGSTPVTLFDPARQPAALLSPGDTVRFRPVSPEEFKALQK